MSTNGKAAQPAQPAQPTEPVLTAEALEVSVPVNLDVIIDRASDGSVRERFPQGKNPNIYNKFLIGVPFLITSEIVYKRQPAKVLDDGGSIPEQDVAQCAIRCVDMAHRRVEDVQLATLAGAYLLNQLHAMTANELMGGYVWTLARNPAMPKTPQKKHPVMLARFDPLLDSPEMDDEGPLDETAPTTRTR